MATNGVVHALLSPAPAGEQTRKRSNALTQTRVRADGRVEDAASEECEEDGGESHETHRISEQPSELEEADSEDDEHADDHELSPLGAHVDAALDLDAAVETELEVSAAIEMHLNEIQRLRASNVIRRARASMGHSPPPPQVRLSSKSMSGFQRQGSLPRASPREPSPKMASQLTAGRSARSFSQSTMRQPHPQHPRSKMVEQVAASMSPDDLRRQINGAPSSRDSSARNSPHSASASDPSDAASRGSSPTRNTDGVLRQRRPQNTRGKHIDSKHAGKAANGVAAAAASSSSSGSTFAVIVSPAPSPRSNQRNQNRSSNLSLDIPGDRAQDEMEQEQAQEEDQGIGEEDEEDPHPDEHTTDQHLASTGQSPGLSRFRHNRTPSMSERLNTSKILLRSPAHQVARSLVPTTATHPPPEANQRQRATSMRHSPPVREEGRQRAMTGAGSGKRGQQPPPHQQLVVEPESEPESEYASDRSDHGSSDGGARVHEEEDNDDDLDAEYEDEAGPPERITQSIFDAEMDHPLSDEDHDDEEETPPSANDDDDPDHELASPAQLAHALKIASSTVNLSQSAASPHSPGRSPGASASGKASPVWGSAAGSLPVWGSAAGSPGKLIIARRSASPTPTHSRTPSGGAHPLRPPHPHQHPHHVKRSSFDSTVRGAVSVATSPALGAFAGSTARPPRSPQQPSLLTVPGIPPLCLLEMSTPAALLAAANAAVTEGVAIHEAARTDAGALDKLARETCAAATTVSTAGTGLSAEELCAVAAAPSKPIPPLKRAHSLPLDGDLLIPAAAADQESSSPVGAGGDGGIGRRPSRAPSILKRSLTLMGLGAKKEGSSMLTPVSAPSPPLHSSASSSPLMSPGSAGLTSAAWLERRMKKMFHPEDVISKSEETNATGATATSAASGAGFAVAGATSDAASDHPNGASTSKFGFLAVLLGLVDPTTFSWSSSLAQWSTWLPAFFQFCLPFTILWQALVIPMRLAFGVTLKPATAAASSSFSSSSAGPLDVGVDDAFARLFFEWIGLTEIPLDALFFFGVLCADYVDLPALTLRAAFKRPGPHRVGLFTQLAVDLVSVVPWELLQCLLPLDSYVASYTAAMPTLLTALLRLPRILRLARLFQYLDQFEARNLVDTYVRPTIVRLTKLGVVMYLVAHQAGCGYVFLSYVELVDLPAGNEWIVPAHIRTQSLGTQYLHAIYWGFCAMTGNGSGVEAPQTALEHIFALVVLLIGVSTYATLIGNLSSIIQSMNSKQESFREKMTSITSLMDTYKLPPDVQHRVKSCFQYLFNVTPVPNHGQQLAATSEQEGASAPRARGEDWDVLQYLPAYLRNELLCFINGEIIHKVPLFRGCSDGFMRSLVPLLKPEVVIPGDYIIRTGEIGREMYLLRHGQLEVIAHGVVVATLSDGSYVGEVAVMFEQKRTASVRAITFCDILVLSKDDFDGVLSQYPEVQRSMKMQATMRRNARNLQDKEFKANEMEKRRKNELAADGPTQPPSTTAAMGKTPRASVARARDRSPNSGTRILITAPSSTPRPTRASGGTSISSTVRSPSGLPSAREGRGSRITTPRKSVAAAASGQQQQQQQQAGASPSMTSVSTPSRSRSGHPGGPGSSLLSPRLTPGSHLAAFSSETNAIEFDPQSGLMCAAPTNGEIESSASATRGTTTTPTPVVASSSPAVLQRSQSKWKKLRLLTRGQ